MSVKIRCQGCQKVYSMAEGEFTAIGDATLQIEEGQFVCIVGPSGCGKSTLLKIIAGLDYFTSGEFEVRYGEGKDQPINNVVFQEYAKELDLNNAVDARFTKKALGILGNY